MIQFNLLPDIKIEYLRARRQKHLVLLSSISATIVCLVVLSILLSIVFVLQRKNIADLSKDIDDTSSQLRGTADLDKMLSVQNQVKALTTLHDAKPVVSRQFSFISQATPTGANISRLRTDYATKSMTISGSADSLVTVNVFADALKFATYHTAKQTDVEKKAFPSVVLTSFGRDNKGASYTITLSFDMTIFSELDEVTLTIPKKITTRSQTEQPSALFQKAETE
jgi:hypothetical protein